MGQRRAAAARARRRRRAGRGWSTDHDDALVREAAVAALGAIGDEAGPAGDPGRARGQGHRAAAGGAGPRPFEGPDVDAALAAAREDRDWQVRQAAEDLSG